VPHWDVDPHGDPLTQSVTLQEHWGGYRVVSDKLRLRCSLLFARKKETSGKREKQTSAFTQRRSESICEREQEEHSQQPLKLPKPRH